MGIEKSTCTFRLDENLLMKIKAYAAAENRSVSNYMETMVRAHIKEKEANKNA